MLKNKARSRFAILHEYVILLDTRDCYTCSFTEFLPFAAAMYYFSTFKAFKALSMA
jgi:hypothetical protein